MLFRIEVTRVGAPIIGIILCDPKVKFRITHPKKLAAEHYVIMTLGVIGQDAPATLDAVSDPVGQTTLRAPVWRSRGIVIGPSV
jgi:hypothetical protein